MAGGSIDADEVGGKTGREPLGRLSVIVRRRQVASFLVVTFAWTWAMAWVARGVLDPAAAVLTRVAAAPATWGPLVGAAVVTWASGGRLRDWAGQVTRWRVRPRLYLFALLVPVAVGEGSNVLYALAGVPLELRGYSPALYALQFVWVLLFTGALEEFGWRGFLQPRLQQRHSALVAGLVVGVVWVLWHLRLFYFGAAGYGELPRYALWVVAAAVVMAWLYNRTGGSVLLVMLFHASNNLPSLTEPAAPVPPALEAVPVSGLLYGGLALGLVAAYGADDLAASRLPDAIPGAPRVVADPAATDRGDE